MNINVFKTKEDMGRATAEKDLQLMAHGLIQCETSSFLPTTLSAPWDDIIKSVDCIAQTMQITSKAQKYWEYILKVSISVKNKKELKIRSLFILQNRSNTCPY
jgi:hypothetical protein